MEFWQHFWDKTIDITSSIIGTGFFVAASLSLIIQSNVAPLLNNPLFSNTSTEIQDEMDLTDPSEVRNSGEENTSLITLQEGEILPLPELDLKAPEGWHLHRLNNSVVLTKDNESPNSGDSETYGIRFQVQYTGDSADDFLQRQLKDESTYAIRVTGGAGGILQIEKRYQASTTALYNYILFDDGELYIFSLHSLGIQNKVPEKDRDALEEFTSDFLTQIIPVKKSQKSGLGLISWHIGSYPSPDGRFAFNIFFLSEENKCVYELTDSAGKRYPVQDLLGFGKIQCDVEYGINSSFVKWPDGTRFILSDDYKTMRVMDLSTMTFKTYKPKNENYFFRDVDASFEHWIFQDGHMGSYILLDGNMNPLFEIENRYGRSGDGVLYDRANKGFLFLGRVYDEESKQSFRLDFLSIDTLKSQNILSTRPIEVPGRGCYPNAASYSIPGEIIFYPGSCFRVAPEYFAPDGYIHISLKIENKGQILY